MFDTIPEYLKNRRVIGSFLVGCAMVAGAYTIANFNRPQLDPTAHVAAAVTKAPERTFIPVKDSNGDGIEDWREEFIPKTPALVAAATSSEQPYIPPSTITEAVGVHFFEQIMQSKAGYGGSTDEVIDTTVNQLANVVNDTLYTTKDIKVVPTTPESLRAYGNAMGAIITNNNIPNSESEIAILDRALKTESEEEIQKILPREVAYKNMRDQALNTPVPTELAKQHLDVINVYNALYSSLRDMRLVFDDPVVSLLRVKRYQDDATGLANALKNLYLGLEPHANLFSASDPAVVLVAFAPNFQ